MATNPMQRKANNSFLLGILITLLITGTIIAFLLMQLSNLNTEIDEINAGMTYAYVVTETIESGTEITSDQVTGVAISGNVTSEVVYSAKTTDSEGNATADTTGSLFPSGLRAKVTLNAGTMITADLIYEEDEEDLNDDLREVEYNVITINTQLQTGDYIDVRLRLPDGTDYIVVSHKEVEIPTIDGVDSTSCIWLELSEDEIMMMSCAIVEAYQMNGAKLYTTTYVEAGIQEAASVTYIPSDEVIALMNEDSNIVDEAKNELFSRYNDSTEKTVVRSPIESAVDNEDAEDNLIESVEEEIEGLQDERERYLESMGY